MSIRVLSLSVFALVMSACSDLEFKDEAGTASNGSVFGSNPNSTSDSVSVTNNAGTVTMNWDLSEGKVYESGVGARKLTTFYEQYGHTYCFENTQYLHDCEVAPSDLRATISSEPVAIQGLQLNFAKSSGNRSEDYSNVVIEGAWVKTAEIGFSSVDGEIKLMNHSTKVIHGDSAEDCSLDDASGMTVGYYNGSRVLTGLYLADEYTVNEAAYYNSHMLSARVNVSGLVPDPRVAQQPGDSGVYSWKFVRSDAASKVDFGLKAFQEPRDSTNQTVAVSNYFGLTAADSINKWDSHVVVGYCIKGYKQFADGYKRPLIHYSVARTHAPKLVYQSR